MARGYGKAKGKSLGSIMGHGTPSASNTQAAFHEVFTNVPKVVARTRRKKGPTAARKQMIAIALNKARRA